MSPTEDKNGGNTNSSTFGGVAGSAGGAAGGAAGGGTVAQAGAVAQTGPGVRRFTALDKTGEELRNWAGLTVLAGRRQIIRPRTVAELSAELRRRTAGSKVKVVGSGLSFEGICALDDARDAGAVMVDMGGFDALRLEAGGARLRLGAGVTVDAAIAFLARHGRMLACSPGVIGLQTVAGAAATGTHGQGLRQASLADTAVALTVVGADGRVRTLEKHVHPDFGAHVAALGLLGIIAELVIETQPLRTFHCAKQNITADAFVESWVRTNQEHEFCKAWWYPETDMVHVWTIDEAAAGAATTKTTQADDESALVDSSLNPTIDRLSAKMAHQTNDAAKTGAHFETIERFRNARSTTRAKPLHELVCKGIPVPQINCEIAVPLEQFAAAMAALRAWTATASNADALHYPFIFRCTGASDAWLSPAHARPRGVVYIGFLVYLAHDGAWHAGAPELMRALQRVLAPVALSAPHLGKHFTPAIWPLAERLPRLRDFKALRARVDPHGRFLNAFLARILDIPYATVSDSITETRRTPPPSAPHQLPAALSLSAKL